MLRAVRRVLTTVLLGCALLLTGWAVGSPASACSCAGGTVADQVAAADVVFAGELVSREVQHPPGSVQGSDDPALHLFTVDAVHKGAATAEQRVVSADSSASCGLDLVGDGPFLVFATDPGDRPGGQLAADLCGGTAPLTPELVAEVERQTGPAAAPAPLDPPRVSAEALQAHGSPSWVPLAMEIGVAVLTLLAGVLAVRRRRRLQRPTTVVVLTRD